MPSREDQIKSRDIFTASGDVWSGGYYELSLEMGPRDDARLENALCTLWEHPALIGCFDRNDTEPRMQKRQSPSLAAAEVWRATYGLIALPDDGMLAACRVGLVREEESKIDFLNLSIPMGSLGLARNVGAFPFYDGASSRPWREPLDARLVEIARHVYAVVPFHLALVGHEVSGEEYADNLHAAGSVPLERWIGYLYPAPAEPGLQWNPPAIYDAPCTFS